MDRRTRPVKMEINTEKNKIMVVNIKKANEKWIKCRKTELEIVTTHEYMGSNLTNNGKIKQVIVLIS